VLIPNLHYRKNTYNEGPSTRHVHYGKLAVRYLEGFINGGWKLYISLSVFSLDFPTMKLG
jgi:hypothetical protein